MKKPTELDLIPEEGVSLLDKKIEFYENETLPLMDRLSKSKAIRTIDIDSSGQDKILFDQKVQAVWDEIRGKSTTYSFGGVSHSVDSPSTHGTDHHTAQSSTSTSTTSSTSSHSHTSSTTSSQHTQEPLSVKDSFRSWWDKSYTPSKDSDKQPTDADREKETAVDEFIRHISKGDRKREAKLQVAYQVLQIVSVLAQIILRTKLSNNNRDNDDNRDDGDKEDEKEVKEVEIEGKDK